MKTPNRAFADAALAALVAVVAYVLAYRALTAHFRVAPAIEDLFATCTGRLGWMPDYSVVSALPQWTAFLDRRLDLFPCDAIAGLRLFEIGTSWEVQRYFHVALYAWFRLVGPSIDGFITFQAASYAVTCVLAYLIFRLGMSRIVALACAAAIVWSPSHLTMAGLPLEYAKAPWVLATVWLCGVLVVRGSGGRSLGWTAFALGLVAGIGIGFKPDVMVLVPLAVVTPLFFVDAARQAGRWRALAAAALLVAAGVAIGGGVMLRRNFFAPTGSAFAIQVIGGQDWQTESLHASSPLYDHGVTWDDTYVDAMINSYGRRVLGTTVRLRFFTLEMQQAADRMLAELWTTFPGDLVLRVIAAIIRVLSLSGLSLLLPLAGAFVVLCRDKRSGWFVVLTTIYLSAAVSLVFQRRHIFHLEFVPWWLAGVAAQALLIAAGPVREAMCERDWGGLFAEARARWLKPAFGAALSLVLIGTGAWLLLTAARQYQQARLIRLVDHYVQMPRETRRVSSSAGSGDVSLRIDGLSAVDDVYLVVTFQCRSQGVIRVTSKYAPPIADSSNWNRNFNLFCAAAGQQSTMMVPVYQPGAGYRFDALVMSESDAAAIASVSTMRADASVTIWPDLFLPSDWRTRRWFETMKWPPSMPI
jgi:hypothetical protein